MMAPSASIPKPNISPLEKLAKFFASVTEEASLRMEKAKTAHAAEMAWQKARRSPAPAPLTANALVIAGLAVEVETGTCLILQEGLNVFGADTLRIEDGRAEGSGAQAGRSHFTNDTVALEGKTYVLKLFSQARFATRTQLRTEAT